ncbi:hypothetical protein [Thermogemmatispora tikiterensis]|uniref:hypothetical protein n=1 Tax=Thermogemmatispora tikiterensis TaxID=1825093 RepID=UPI0011BFE62E|nr:hypothetical protein [Thermogemmatispora tikiterensis]
MELLTDRERQAKLLIELAEWLLRQPGRLEEGWQRCRRAAQVIAQLSDGWAKARLLIRLGEALSELHQQQEAERCWQEAERVLSALPDHWRKGEALSELVSSLAQAHRWHEAVRLIQGTWLQVVNRHAAFDYLPLAFPLIPAFPELGMALYDATCWAEAFLQGPSGPSSRSLLRARSSDPA